MKEKKITVCIPTYRRPQLLAQALQSALEQTAPPEAYDILVVDNDPAANTETERMMGKMRDIPNLRYVKNEQNVGGYGNWNRAFAMARTEWVCLLHDDDLLLPVCIERALTLLDELESPRLGAVIPWQCNLYDDPQEESEQAAQVNWKGRIDEWLHQKTAGKRWRINLFDNYMISSAYPALSGGNLIRRSAVLQLGGFGTKWPCEDIFLMNRMARQYDCWLIGEQWGWYRFGMNNMWARPLDLVKWDKAKKLFREKAAQQDLRCRLYHKIFGKAMCFFDRNESIRFAKKRGTNIDPALYTWLDGVQCNPVVLRLCRLNRNAWHIWLSARAKLFGKRV